MKYYFIGFARLAVIVPTAILVGACGVTPGHGGGADSSTSKTSGLTQTNNGDNYDVAEFAGPESALAEELALRSNKYCGETQDRFAVVIRNIADRFNDAFSDAVIYGDGKNPSRRFPPVGHPAPPDDGSGRGISILVCSDSLLEAYSYSHTIALHEGLLMVIEKASEAAALSTDKADLGNMLDKIVNDAQRGDFGWSPDTVPDSYIIDTKVYDKKIEDLFVSALAFVIYHELGHSALGHSLLRYGADSYDDGPYGPGMETQADIFAANAMVATGLPMDGIDLVFSILDRISPDGSSVHPSSGERVQNLKRATEFEDYALLME